MGFRFRLMRGSEVSNEPPRLTLKYEAIDAPSVLPGGDFFDYVASYALSNTPAFRSHPSLGGTLYRQDIRVSEEWYAKKYVVTVPYAPEQKQSGAYQISVDISGETVHVTAGTRIAGYATVAADEEDNGGLIGVDGDQVHGADIPIGKMAINVSYRHPQGQLNGTYIRSLKSIVGHPNSDTFLGFDPGEVMFLGGNFSESDTEATAQYSFAVSENASNFDVGGITVTEKKGFDILSPIYKTDKDANNHGVRALKCIEIIRPPLGDWVAYGPVFGWS